MDEAEIRSSLTPRDEEIIKLSIKGLTVSEIAKKLNKEYVPILTDLFTFQKDRHNIEYFKNMANQTHDITKEPIKFLLFRPIFEKFSKKINDRLMFKVTNDYT